MKVCTPTPPSTPLLVPMEVDKMYTIPARRQTPNPKDEERRKGLCHLCKRHGHIQRHCPKKTPTPPARAASTQITPPIADQVLRVVVTRIAKSRLRDSRSGLRRFGVGYSPRIGIHKMRKRQVCLRLVLVQKRTHLESPRREVGRLYT